MRDITHDTDRLRRVVLIVVALGITLLFLGMISQFLNEFFDFEIR